MRSHWRRRWRQRVIRLRPHRSGRHTHLHAEHFKQWRREAYPGENLKTPPQMELWLFLVDLVHNMWNRVGVPQELGWIVLVLISKGTTNTQGIGLLETLWKVVEVLINTRLRVSLQLHDVLHGFRAGRGVGTAIMELKLAPELASIDQDPLFLVLLYLRKAYDTVDWERLLVTLEGYGTFPSLCGLLNTFWGRQQVVPRQNGFYRPYFPATRGTKQGSPVSLTLFNVVVDNFIITWLAMIVEDQRVAHDWLGETDGACLGVFYANDGMVGSQDADRL